MAILNIRRLPDDTHARLRLRAADNRRLTITLTPEQAEAIRAYALRHGTSLEICVQQLVDRGLSPGSPPRPPFRIETRHMGVPTVDLADRDQLYRRMEE